MGWTADDLAARLTRPYKATPGSNNYKLMEVFAEGFWAQLVQDVEDFRRNEFIDTMDAEPLRKWARILGLTQNEGESLEAFRVRVKADVARRTISVHPDEILVVVEGMLEAEPGNVKIFENEDPVTGAYKPAYFYITFPSSLVGDVTVAQINTILGQIAAAGVKGEVVLGTDAVFDDATYDEGHLYGT